MQKRMGWWSRIQGDKAIREKIAEVFPKGDLRVEHEEGEFFLSVPGFGPEADSLAVSNTAERIVRRMAALINVLAGLGGEVWVDTALYTWPNGQQRGMGPALRGTIRVYSAQHVEKLSKVVAGRTLGQAFLASDIAGSELLSILTEIGGGELGWDRLYKLYESVVRACGTQTVVAQRCATTKNELRRFKQSANVLRHAPDPVRYPPPLNPMKVQEARAFVQSLLWRVLEYQVSQLTKVN